MPITRVVDTPTSSLASSGLNETAATTIARLVCDTTVGADDLTTVNAQNNFVQELVAAVGPVIAFNAICRQLVKINNTVAHPYSGTVYSAISADTYKNYLDSYIMRDSFTNIEVTSDQTTYFIDEQWQTLAAFANAGLSLDAMLSVVDYHILMIYLTKGDTYLVGSGSGGVNTLCVNFSLSSNAPSPTFLKYGTSDNLKTAKYRYAISTLAQNGAPAFADSVSVDHIVGGLLVDPVYTGTPSTGESYGLIASLATVTSQNHSIRSSYGNLITPVQYILSGSNLVKRPRTASGTPSPAYNSVLITLTILSDYSKLPSTQIQNMSYFKTVDGGIGQTPAKVAGTVFDPTTKQLMTVSSLQSQSAQAIYNSLSFTSSNSVNNATIELAAFKLYGKKIQEIRSVVDAQGYGIPYYNSIASLFTAGYSITEITNAFSELGNGNYDFAVLIGVCTISPSTTSSNKLKYEPITTGNYEFKYVDPNAIGSSVFVNKLRSIITTPDSDVIIGMTQNGIAANLRLHMLNSLKEIVAGADKITDANSEPAVLRYLHISAALGSEIASALSAFASFTGISNCANFMNLPYTLAASPSGLAPPAFLKLSEFSKYTAGSELSYGVGSGTYLNKVNSLIAASSSPSTRQYFIDSASGAIILPSKQFYSLGYAGLSYYNSATGTTGNKSFDNGYSFTAVYTYMATSTASKIENIYTNGWPKAIVFTHTSMLLADTCTYIMKKMNSSFPTQVSDDALLIANASYPSVWTSFTDLLIGTQKNNSIDNIAYKTLLRAGANAQYIKIDLVKNLVAGITNVDLSDIPNGANVASQRTSLFAGFGLPFSDALYVARKVNSSPFTVKDIVSNTKFSRFERRKVFDNVQQAAQQLDKSTFLGLVWQYADLEANIKGNNPLNIQLVDLLSLTYSAQEADADGYLNNTAASRLAYHDAVVRKNMVRLFYPTLSEDAVALVASLNNVDEILDELASRSLIA